MNEMMQVDFDLKSFIGTREEQQDFAFVGECPDGIFSVLCDGMGGHRGGATASKTAVKQFVELAQNKKSGNIPDFYIRSVRMTNELIFNLKDKYGKRLNAGTTIVSVIISDKNLFWLSAGDSRLYIFRNGEIKQITKDHNYSLVLKEQFEKNLISESEYAKKKLKGGALVSYLGTSKLNYIDINLQPLVLKNNDIILLTSDGLYKCLTDDMISYFLSKQNIHLAATKMIEAVKGKNENSIDNTTFVLIKIKSS